MRINFWPTERCEELVVTLANIRLATVPVASVVKISFALQRSRFHRSRRRKTGQPQVDDNRLGAKGADPRLQWDVLYSLFPLLMRLVCSRLPRA